MGEVGGWNSSNTQWIPNVVLFLCQPRKSTIVSCLSLLFFVLLALWTRVFWLGSLSIMLMRLLLSMHDRSVPCNESSKEGYEIMLTSRFLEIGFHAFLVDQLVPHYVLNSSEYIQLCFHHSNHENDNLAIILLQASF